MLRGLESAGKVILPPRQKSPRTKGGADRVAHFEHDTSAIHAKLAELQPLRVSRLSGGAELTQFKSLIDQYHYLQYDRSIGENMKYMVYDRNDRVLACLLFGSAAWSCRDRDSYIGWNKHERSQRLRFLTNNSRYLVLPWVKCFNLASHTLSLVAKRISADWEGKYGHGLAALETFVDRSRVLRGGYRASNWI
jgi:hypothetical protein